MKQERKQHGSHERHEETSEEQARTVGEAAVKSDELDEAVDTILDEIDAVLETNAEEFVNGFVQKGGQ